MPSKNDKFKATEKEPFEENKSKLNLLAGYGLQKWLPWPLGFNAGTAKEFSCDMEDSADFFEMLMKKGKDFKLGVSVMGGVLIFTGAYKEASESGGNFNKKFLKRMLNSLEKHAKNILLQHRLPTKLEKLQEIKAEAFDINKDVNILCAIQVLFFSENVKKYLKKNETAWIVIETMSLVFYYMGAVMVEIIKQGARTKTGQRAVKMPRAAIAIKEAMKTVLKEHPRYNYNQLWNYFKKEHTGPAEARNIILNGRRYDVFYSHIANEINEIQYHPIYTNEIFSNKHIGKDRFKKYFNEAK